MTWKRQKDLPRLAVTYQKKPRPRVKLAQRGKDMPKTTQHTSDFQTYSFLSSQSPWSNRKGLFYHFIDEETQAQRSETSSSAHTAAVELEGSRISWSGQRHRHRPLGPTEEARGCGPVACLPPRSALSLSRQSPRRYPHVPVRSQLPPPARLPHGASLGSPKAPTQASHPPTSSTLTASDQKVSLVTDSWPQMPRALF